MHRRYIVRSAVFCLMASLLLACGRPDAQAGAVGSQPNATEIPSSPIVQTNVAGTTQPPVTTLTSSQPTTEASVAPVAYSASYMTAQSLQESISQSEMIVIGNVDGIGAIYNTARDTQDHTKPAKNTFSVGQVYTFHVERYLKGTGPVIIPILQDEGMILLPEAAIAQVDIDRAKAASGTTPLNKGVQYLLFLSHTDAFNGTTYYGGSAEPWRFVLAADGSARMDTPRDAYRMLPANFAPPDAVALLAQIEQLVKAAPSATPAK